MALYVDDQTGEELRTLVNTGGAPPAVPSYGQPAPSYSYDAPTSTDTPDFGSSYSVATPEPAPYNPPVSFGMGDAEGTNVYQPPAPVDWGPSMAPAYDWGQSAPMTTETPDFSGSYAPPAVDWGGSGAVTFGMGDQPGQNVYQPTTPAANMGWGDQQGGEYNPWQAQQDYGNFQQAKTSMANFGTDGWYQPSDTTDFRPDYTPVTYNPQNLRNFAPGGGNPGGAESSGLGGQFGRAAEVLAAPQKYVGGPVAMRTAAMLRGDDYSNLLTDPAGAYGEAYTQNQDFLNDPNGSWVTQNLYRTLTDPVTYAGMAGAGKIGGLGGALLDQGSPNAIVGANLLGEAAQRYGDNIPYFGDQPSWLQGLEGNVAGFTLGGHPVATARGIAKAGTLAHDAAIGLDARINEPAGFGRGGGVQEAGMAVGADNPNYGNYMETLAEHGIDARVAPDGSLHVVDRRHALSTADEMESLAAQHILGTRVPGGVDASNPYHFGTAEYEDAMNNRRIQREEGKVTGNTRPLQLPAGDASDFKAMDDAERIREVVQFGRVDPAKEAARQPFAEGSRLADYSELPDAQRTALEEAAANRSKGNANAGKAAAQALGEDDAVSFVNDQISPDMNPRAVVAAIGSEIDSRGFTIGRTQLSVREKAFRAKLQEIADEVSSRGHDVTTTEASSPGAGVGAGAVVPEPGVTGSQAVGANEAPVGKEPTVKRIGLDGTVTDTFQTEAELAGIRPTQGGMDLGGVAADKRAALEGTSESPRTTPQAEAAVPPPPEIPRGAADRAPNEDPNFATAARKILDATTAEANIRKVGTAEREIRTGRGVQFGNIMDTVNSGADVTAEELAAQARGSARVGKLRQTTAEAIDLTPGEKNAVINDVVERMRSGELPPHAIFDVTGKDSALEKLIAGEGLAPAEIKWVRNTFGDEVADAVKDRPITRAQVLAQDAKEQAASQAYSERAIARQQAQAEAELVRQNREIASRQETSDRAVQRTRWRNIAQTNSVEEIQQRLANPFMTAEERAIAQKEVTRATETAQREVGRKTQEVWDRAARDNPDAETLKRKAQSIIEEKVADPRTRAAVEQTVALWSERNGIILKGLGDEGRVAEVTGSIGRVLAGDVADSHLATLLHQKANLQTALEMQGMDAAVAKTVADTLVQRQLKLRYPDGVPAEIGDQLATTRSLPYGDKGGQVLQGAATLSQEIKNTMFGPADIGVFGQQLLKAVTTGSLNIMAGVTNRLLTTLHMPHIETLFADASIPKRVQYQLDGVIQGARTGIVGDVEHEGTLFRMFGKPGRVIDQPLGRFIGAMSDFQFGTVLGNIRNLNHEGNLVLAHLAGADITNPSVRAQAAAFANSNTSAASRALSTRRALLESASILSPSMRRAQVAQIVQVAKALGPSASRTERVLAATAIASAAGSVLAVGKLLNDYVGLGTFEFDPSKPGFGSITVPSANGKPFVVNLFPQEQIIKALAQSARVLAEERDRDGGVSAAKAWTNLLLSSSSPALQIAEKSVGLGYEPGRGYRYGDFNNGKGLGGRILNAAPIPPLVMSLVTGDLNPFTKPERTAIEALGGNTFDESPYAAKQRDLEAAFPGRDLNKNPLSPVELNKYKAENPDSPATTYKSTNPDAVAATQRRASDVAALVKTQQGIDQQYIATGSTVPINPVDAKNWRDEYHTNQFAARAVYAKDQRDFPYTGAQTNDPMRKALDEWGSVIDANARGTKVNWDKVDQWRAENPDKAALVDQYMSDPNKPNKDLTPAVTAYKAAAKQIADAGYFAVKDDVWKQITAQNPSVANFATYFDFKDDVEAQVKSQAAGAPQVVVDKIVANIIDKNPIAKIYSKLSNAAETQWIIANPKVANVAYEWGYLKPTNKERAVIGAAGQ